MALFVLSDPHLANGVDKPMAVFGPHWNHHTERIRENWLLTVAPEDTVVLPGDISWALTLSEALPDLQFLQDLPGDKILSRGNHDYWWTTVKKMQSFIDENSFRETNRKMSSTSASLSTTRRNFALETFLPFSKRGAWKSITNA